MASDKNRFVRNDVVNKQLGISGVVFQLQYDHRHWLRNTETLECIRQIGEYYALQRMASANVDFRITNATLPRCLAIVNSFVCCV